MSGECETCHEHCLDCRCGKQDLPVGMIKTGYAVKIKPMFIVIRPLKNMKEEVNHPNYYQGKSIE